MVVSYPRVLDIVFERSLLLLARHVGPTFRVERCQHPSKVPWLVKQWSKRGHDITRLEFLGHGKPGAFQLGDGMLFDAGGTGLDTIEAVGASLTRDARVNLLGCRVAWRAQSEWLVPFEAALGAKRTLWGAASWVSHAAFRHGPISAEIEAGLVRAGPTPEKRNPRRSRSHTAGRGKNGR